MIALLRCWCSAGLAAVFLCGAAAQASPIPDLDRVRVPSAAVLQESVDKPWACTPAMMAAYRQAGLPEGNSLRTLSAINRFVGQRFSYRVDRVERWDNFSLSVLAGKRVRGDCEDFAITVTTLALCGGVPADQLGFAMTRSKRGPLDLEGIDHAIGLYLGEEGTHVIADTARRGVRKFHQRSARVILWQKIERLRENPGLYQSSLALRPEDAYAKNIGSANSRP